MVIRLRFEVHAIAGRGCMRSLPKGNPQQSRLVPAGHIFRPAAQKSARSIVLTERS
jgi:hypothetical protein